MEKEVFFGNKMSISPKLSRFDLSMIVVSLVVGMGIFATPGQVAKYLHNPYLYFIAWVIGGIISFCGALTFAEIGSAYPATGGFYKVFSHCFNPAIAFMVNWILVLSNAMSVAAIILIGAQYILPVIMPINLHNQTGIKIITITSVITLYLLNLLGIKASANTQNILTCFKIGLILILCTAIGRSHSGFGLAIDPNPPIHVINSFGLSLVAIFFTYGGYQQTINFGGDIINAKSNLPKAIFTGLLIVITLYMLINIAYVSVLGMDGLQRRPALAAALAGVIFGSTGFKLVSVLMFASVLAYVNVNFMANPRVYYAMAEDGVLPMQFKKLNKRTQVQEFGLTFFVAAILVVLFFIESFQNMLSYVMFFDTIGLSIAALCIFILRSKAANTDHLTNAYRIKGYPWIPLLFIVSYWSVTIIIFVEHPQAALICLLSFLIGFVIYFFTKRGQKPILNNK
ncbi:APC family permease [Mucilaginibacter sp. CSA2-8R]|uniref:APC family permease n=1 Tax=Mucilaginibacter sp. CSA2-8R TaxID=3141542 RepID=UPI00315CF3AC